MFSRKKINSLLQASLLLSAFEVHAQATVTASPYSMSSVNGVVTISRTQPSYDSAYAYAPAIPTPKVDPFCAKNPLAAYCTSGKAPPIAIQKPQPAEGLTFTAPMDGSASSYETSSGRVGVEPQLAQAPGLDQSTAYPDGYAEQVASEEERQPATQNIGTSH